MLSVCKIVITIAITYSIGTTCLAGIQVEKLKRKIRWKSETGLRLVNVKEVLNLRVHQPC